MSRTELECYVLSNLSHTAWKTPLELIRTIAEKRKKAGHKSVIHSVLGYFSHTLDNLLWEPTTGKLYAILTVLEDAQDIESRWRNDSPEQLAKRNGYRAREYRLTMNGIRRRAASADKNRRAEPAWNARPA